MSSTVRAGLGPAPCDVLVVDDDDDVRGVVEQLLEQQGYSALSATNGKEALELLRRTANVPALILLDLMMPQMDGWEFLVLLRMEDVRLRRVPIVIMSAHPSVCRPVGVREAPFAQCLLLPKPFDASRLLAVVSQAVHGDKPPI
jgi:CheY-like chemotaxis protein